MGFVSRSSVPVRECTCIISLRSVHARRFEWRRASNHPDPSIGREFEKGVKRLGSFLHSLLPNLPAINTHGFCPVYSARASPSCVLPINGGGEFCMGIGDRLPRGETWEVETSDRSHPGKAMDGKAWHGETYFALGRETSKTRPDCFAFFSFSCFYFSIHFEKKKKLIHGYPACLASHFR